MNEYLKVKDMTYLEYCDYLQGKYGIGLSDYMTKSFNKNAKCSRTKDGLIAHHKMEDTMIMLSTKEIAMNCPFEWQSKENIVYCDYLEHLLLHTLICKYPNKNKMPLAKVGYGGVVNFLVPELNDLYSGWKTAQPWRQKCHSIVIDDKDVYLAILKQFMSIMKNDTVFKKSDLLTSYNQQFAIGNNGWTSKNNTAIYKEIKKLK